MFGGGKSMKGLKFKSIGGGGFLVLLTAVVLRFILIAIQSALVQLAYNNIWRLIQTVMTSFMEQIITCSNEYAPASEYLKIIEEAGNFKVYANDSFYKACSVFGSTSCPGIDDNWREIYNYKKFLKKKQSNTSEK